MVVVLLAYLFLGVHYAVLTPLWQVPDEPAHFNYVAQLADGDPQLPEIASGDYPTARLEQLKATRFPPDQSVAGIEYEDHQPPAYYALAAVVDVVSGPTADLRRRVHRLRLLGVLFGAVTVFVAARIARLAVPGDDALALGVAAMVAFLPMHLTMTASVNNDPLAYLVVALGTWLALGRALGKVGQRAFWMWGGVLIGLAFWTKLSAYSVAPLLVAAEGVAWWRRGRFGTLPAVLTAVQTVLVGAGIGLPWFMRNTALYGAGDWFGTHRHDAVVVGQITTVDWIRDHGLADLLARMVEFTFKSFWGVFGWLGVFLDERIYQALAVLTAAALVGAGLYVADLWRRPDREAAEQRASLFLLGLVLVMTLAGFVWWNWTFVQHQGRYLFPALVPIAIAFQLGLREWTRRIGGFLRLSKPLTDALEWACVAAFAVGLAGLAWVSLTRYIVPGLA